MWSFYQQPDAGLFLHEAYRYFARGAAPATSAKGSGILHLLHDALTMGGPHLLVVDGLERVRFTGSGTEESVAKLTREDLVKFHQTWFRPNNGTLVVVGDTESDAGSGVAAGAGLIVGVLTGGRSASALQAAGAHEELASVADLPALLDRVA